MAKKKRRKRNTPSALRKREKWLTKELASALRGFDTPAGTCEYLQQELAKVQKQLEGAKKRAPTRPLSDLIVDAAKRVAELKSYQQGTYAQELGVKPTTPCVTIHDPQMYRFLLKQTVHDNLPPRPLEAQICHRCDNGKCVNADHLFWGTRSDNMRDCSLKGRLKGKKPFAQKLEEAEERLRRLLERAQIRSDSLPQ